MVDPMHKVVRNDPRINWICNPVHVSAPLPLEKSTENHLPDSLCDKLQDIPSLTQLSHRTLSSSAETPRDRGLTAAGRKYRGLQGKGHNYNKARPSKRGTWKRNQQISLKRYR